MKNTIVYPYMPEGKTVSYVDSSDIFMTAAKEAARKSNDQQQPTGAVIVSGGIIVAQASNMNPLKQSWLIALHKKFCIRHFFGIPSGQKYWLCPGCAGKESHAESRAAKQLIKEGVPAGPLDLYLWGHWWCCDTCWHNMMKVPIEHVYLLSDGDKLFSPKHKDNILGKQFK